MAFSIVIDASLSTKDDPDCSQSERQTAEKTAKPRPIDSKHGDFFYASLARVRRRRTIVTDDNAVRDSNTDFVISLGAPDGGREITAQQQTTLSSTTLENVTDLSCCPYPAASCRNSASVEGFSSFPH
tara:strand:- start:705 stop:1088 length:384 start_codon:yes stop_codon:yes gene_type:complete